jgi:hypothetical protein
VAVGTVGEACEGLQELPGGLAWLLMCGDPGKRPEELSTLPTPSSPHAGYDELAMLCGAVPGLFMEATHPSQHSSTQHPCWLSTELSPRAAAALKANLLDHCYSLFAIAVDMSVVCT